MSHKLKIANGQLFLDGFEVKKIKSYELRSSAENGLTELTLKLVVKDLDIQVNSESVDTKLNEDFVKALIKSINDYQRKRRPNGLTVI
jgi:dimeric dUTPase (all-alpha-NTP-PPase superfamily)